MRATQRSDPDSAPSRLSKRCAHDLTCSAQPPKQVYYCLSMQVVSAKRVYRIVPDSSLLAMAVVQVLALEVQQMMWPNSSPSQSP